METLLPSTPTPNAESKTSNSIFTILPTELFFQIFSYLRGADAKAVGATCRRFNDLVRPTLFRQFHTNYPFVDSESAGVTKEAFFANDVNRIVRSVSIRTPGGYDSRHRGNILPFLDPFTNLEVLVFQDNKNMGWIQRMTFLAVLIETKPRLKTLQLHFNIRNGATKAQVEKFERTHTYTNVVSKIKSFQLIIANKAHGYPGVIREASCLEYEYKKALRLLHRFVDAISPSLEHFLFIPEYHRYRFGEFLSSWNIPKTATVTLHETTLSDYAYTEDVSFMYVPATFNQVETVVVACTDEFSMVATVMESLRNWKAARLLCFDTSLVTLYDDADNRKRVYPDISGNELFWTDAINQLLQCPGSMPALESVRIQRGLSKPIKLQFDIVRVPPRLALARLVGVDGEVDAYHRRPLYDPELRWEFWNLGSLEAYRYRDPDE